MWAGCTRFRRDLFFSKGHSRQSCSALGIIGFLGGLPLEIKFDSGSKEHSGSTFSVIGDDEESPRIRNQIWRARFGSRFLADAYVDADIDRWCGARLGEHAFQRRFCFFTKAAVVTFRRRICSPALRCGNKRYFIMAG